MLDARVGEAAMGVGRGDGTTSPFNELSVIVVIFEIRTWQSSNLSQGYLPWVGRRTAVFSLPLKAGEKAVFRFGKMPTMDPW